MQANLGLMIERKAKISCNSGQSVIKNLRARQDCRRTSQKTDFRQENETSAGLKITFVNITYPDQRPKLPSLFSLEQGQDPEIYRQHLDMRRIEAKVAEAC